MDGCYINGYTRPKNKKEDRLDLRLSANKNPNERCVMVARQRASEDSDMVGAVATMTIITKGEYSNAINKIATTNIELNSTIHVDGAKGYDDLSAWFDVESGDHGKAYMGENSECSNQAESFFSRFRRMQIGTHHKLSNLYLSNYANEAAYREDTRRLSNGAIFRDILGKAMNTPTHSEWCGYWQGNKRVTERLVA